MAIEAPDQAAAEAFAGKMLQTLNDGFVALMISVGHRTGLFDAMATLPPATSQQIADAANLNERYVREWLGGMVVGRIVEYDPAAAPISLGPYTINVAAVEDAVVVLTEAIYVAAQAVDTRNATRLCRQAVPPSMRPASPGTRRTRRFAWPSAGTAGSGSHCRLPPRRTRPRAAGICAKASPMRSRSPGCVW